MRNDRLARSYFKNAQLRLQTAEMFLRKGIYHLSFQNSQGAIEFFLKAVLRAMGIEYPKEHDVSDILEGVVSKLPIYFKDNIKKIKKISKEGARKRGLSIYGDEVRGVPAEELIRREDAESLLDGAKYIGGIVEMFLREINFI